MWVGVLLELWVGGCVLVACVVGGVRSFSQSHHEHQHALQELCPVMIVLLLLLVL